MNILRIIIINVVLGWAYSCSAGAMADNVGAKITEVDQNIATLEKTKAQLSKQYAELNDQLNKTIKEKVNTEIETAINGIAAGKTSIGNIDGRILHFIGIGDLASALDKINATLQEVKTQLLQVPAIFGPIIADLSPTTDPKGIYKQFDNAIANMKKAKEEMEAMRKFLTALNI